MGQIVKGVKEGREDFGLEALDVLNVGWLSVPQLSTVGPRRLKDSF